MDTNEVMTNEEVIETATEEIMKAGSEGSLKMVAGFGLGILTGMVICKLAKPVIAKFKVRKEAEQMPEVVVEADVVETEEESEE